MLHLKLLAGQLQSARRELKLSTEILQSAAREIEVLFRKHLVEIGEQPPVKNKDNKEQKEVKEQEESVDDDPPQLVKQAFKKIATQIHPDKLLHLEDEEEKAAKTEIYQKAIQAMEDRDLVVLLDILHDLGSELPDISESDLENTKNKISSIKEELAAIHSTLAWKWHTTFDKKRKDSILKEIFGVLYERHKKKNPGP